MRLFSLLLFSIGLSHPGAAQGRVHGQVHSYQAQQGDTLLSIARRYGLAIDHLCFANGWPTNATEIYPGTQVIVPGLRILPQDPPPTGMVINVPERILYRFQQGQFKSALPCSVGHPKLSPTPNFRATVREKVKDPIWYPPEWAKQRAPVKPGKDNPLGDRWLGLSYGRYGIHSTYDPENVGNDVTHGCIRLFPEDLRALFPSVQLGERVEVAYETVKIGRNLSGQLILVAYPDIYQRDSPAKRAQALVERWGGYWTQKLAQEVKKGQGLPIVVPAQATKRSNQ